MFKISIKEYLKKSIDFLESQNIKNAGLDAEILLCYFLKKDKSWLYSNFNYKLNQNQQKTIDKLIKQRSKNIPVAQITKEKEFYKLKFFVNKNILVPRPETELIVEEAIHVIRSTQHATLIDIGTGSGAVIIALAKNIQNSEFFASDISEKALYVARKNARLHKVNKKIKFLKGNLLEPIIKNKKLANKARSYVITANLPYLTPTQFKEEKSIQAEPKKALISGNDGLKDYRKFFKQLKKLTNHSQATIIIEFDPSQTNKLKKIIKQNFPKAKTQTKKDLSGLNRVMVIKI
ncbi:peptide chain release factor N(5)-glutamine methyltransferase [Candidatus Falkowbacteria bacterium]|jgi:release factor glutamine methyltransferase|nr:peptide chain release factor N(5)-glutamine methyltransferase [Candidatus Falkowbacteria bacterium]MBT4433059.1 peptide chain release factor N(5)-glutamine methyltransferase [Candidatus Falkowbacteria bacterium]